MNYKLLSFSIILVIYYYFNALMDTIPPETLFQILSWVPHPPYLRLVCKQWMQLLPIKEVMIIYKRNPDEEVYKYEIVNFRFKENDNTIKFGLYKIVRCRNCGIMHDKIGICCEGLLDYNIIDLPPKPCLSCVTILKRLYLIANRSYTFNIASGEMKVYITDSSKIKVAQSKFIDIRWQDVYDGVNIAIKIENKKDKIAEQRKALIREYLIDRDYVVPKNFKQFIANALVLFDRYVLDKS